MSEAAEKRAERIIRAEKKTRRKGEPPREWTWERAKSMRHYIPQGSTIGDTLIQLGDTYEGSPEDCRYVEAACTEAPMIARDLLAALRRQDGAHQLDPGQGLRPATSLRGSWAGSARGWTL
jgi:hypothetical protein